MKTRLLFLILLVLQNCAYENLHNQHCLPYEGRVVYDPECWGIIIQVLNTKVSDETFGNHSNVLQIMDMDISQDNRTIKTWDSLLYSERFVTKSFFFNYRTNDRNYYCTADKIWVSLQSQIIITDISETDCVQTVDY